MTPEARRRALAALASGVGNLPEESQPTVLQLRRLQSQQAAADTRRAFNEGSATPEEMEAANADAQEATTRFRGLSAALENAPMEVPSEAAPVPAGPDADVAATLAKLRRARGAMESASTARPVPVSDGLPMPAFRPLDGARELNPEVRAYMEAKAAPAPAAGTDEFAAAQDAARERRMAQAILRMGQGVNTALTGAKAPESGVDAETPLQELAALRAERAQKTDLAQKAALRDPNSAESMRLKALLGATGADLPPEVLAQLTAADAPQAFQAANMQSDARARELARKESADRFAAEDARRRDDQTRQQQQFYAQLAESRAGRQASANLQRELAGMSARERAALKAETQQQRESERFEKDVETAGKDLEGASLMRGDLKTLADAAAKKDIPGVGPWDSRMSGLLGRIPFAGATADDIKTIQAARGIVGTLIKQRSGTAASDAEVDRIMEELGMGDGATEEQYRSGLERLSREASAALSSKEAKFRPNVLREYEKRGGVLSADLPRYVVGQTPDIDLSATPPAAGTARMRTPDGAIVDVPRERADEFARDHQAVEVQ